MSRICCGLKSKIADFSAIPWCVAVGRWDGGKPRFPVWSNGKLRHSTHHKVFLVAFAGQDRSDESGSATLICCVLTALLRRKSPVSHE